MTIMCQYWKNIVTASNIYLFLCTFMFCTTALIFMICRYCNQYLFPATLHMISKILKMTVKVSSKTSTTAVDTWHLRVEEDISLTKNYCITISIQKIRSIHKFILNMQQILESHELTGYGHF